LVVKLLAKIIIFFGVAWCLLWKIRKFNHIYYHGGEAPGNAAVAFCGKMGCVLRQNGLRFAAKWAAFCGKMEMRCATFCLLVLPFCRLFSWGTLFVGLTMKT